MENTVKLVAMSEVQVAKDGRKYFTGTFDPGFGQLKVKRNMWEQFKRDLKTGLPTDQKFWERGTPEQAKALIANGGEIEGRKVTRKVEKYIIGSGETAREVDSYSTIVFADENEVVVFANAGHNILDESTGELLGKKPAVLASNKVAEESSIEQEAK